MLIGTINVSAARFGSEIILIFSLIASLEFTLYICLFFDVDGDEMGFGISQFEPANNT